MLKKDLVPLHLITTRVHIKGKTKQGLGFRALAKEAAWWKDRADEDDFRSLQVPVQASVRISKTRNQHLLCEEDGACNFFMVGKPEKGKLSSMALLAILDTASQPPSCLPAQDLP
jgi:hypothetical protein